MNSGLINLQTKISVLIKHHPAVIDALAALNPNFKKLKNPILRKLLASRVTIKDACKIAGAKPADFMQKMQEIGFNVDDSNSSINHENITAKNFPFENLESVELDVRASIAKGEDPLKLILRNVKSLTSNQCLKLINNFEPLPLIQLLAQKGFIAHVERPRPDEVITWFAKKNQHQREDIKLHHKVENTDDEFNHHLKAFTKIETINVRHLEMPLPMVTILQCLEKLPQEEALFVKHKKVPLILLEQLKERGFECLMQRIDDKNVNLLIFKP